MKYSEVRRYTSTGRRKTKDEIMASYRQQYRVRCECGHTMMMVNVTKRLCPFCKKYVFKDKKEEMKYRVNEKLRRSE